MSRQDIHVDATFGEVNTIDNLTNKVIFDFVLLAEEGNTHYCYGEILVPYSLEKKFLNGTNLHVSIPYIPIHKQILVRLRLRDDNDTGSFIINKTTNKHWFRLCLESETEADSKICMSQLPGVNQKGIFNLIYRNGLFILFSGDDTDFQIKASLKQNEIFLLKAFASNLYQHPTTGVGLIEYLHGNFENSGLAIKLQQEFENDNMVIINAYMDTNSGELLLEVKEKDGQV